MPNSVRATKDQKRRKRIGRKINQSCFGFAEKILDSGRRSVADPQPDNFRRCAVDAAEPIEINIFTYDHETIVCRVRPDGVIRWGGTKAYEQCVF